MDHGLCCDERAYAEKVGIWRIIACDSETYAAGVAYERGDFVLLTKSNSYSFAVKCCPACGTELDAGAEGVDDDSSEETPINSAHAPQPPERLPVGSLVVALEVIDDIDSDGQRYIHAEPGDIGIVCAYHDPDPDSWPTINWSGEQFRDYWTDRDGIISIEANDGWENSKKTSGFGTYDCEVGARVLPLQTKQLQRDGSRK